MPEKTTPKHRLDPRAPFVLDTRTLGREPGAMRTVQRRVPAPAGLRLDLIGVPEGAPLDLDLRLESASEGVLVTGTATTTIAGDRKSTRLNSSHVAISYAVFCLKQKKT